MIIFEQAFEDYNEKVLAKQVDVVNHKIAVRVNVQKQMSKAYLKSLVRAVFTAAGVGIRYRVDIGEDQWLRKDAIYGAAVVVVRVSQPVPGALAELQEAVANLHVTEQLEIVAVQTFGVGDFSLISEKFDRALYEVTLDVGTELAESLNEFSGSWVQDVQNWNGTVETTKLEGLIRLKCVPVNSKSPVYKILVDVPLGVDVYRVLEQHFSLKKNSLLDYPIKGVLFYEAVAKGRNYLARRKCTVLGETIELTVGGLVGAECVSALMGLAAEDLSK